jgi:hypothetical protein
MSWLKRLVKVFGWDISSISKEDPIIAPEEPEKMHCIRFMTEKGEQIGILLTSQEFERGIHRWVDTIQEMPIDAVDPQIDEGIM